MIACLGWGSLIWDPRGLLVDNLASCGQGQGHEAGNVWRKDGPCVKVEFVRQSLGGHLTLVLYSEAEPVPSLWVRMRVNCLAGAVNALAEREGTPKKNIGRWPRDGGDPKNICNLESWASRQGVDHVIWTALKPKVCRSSGVPTEDVLSEHEAVSYLSNLSGCVRAKAEEYVRRAPPQIDTAYRRRIAHCLGWTPGA